MSIRICYAHDMGFMINPKEKYPDDEPVCECERTKEFHTFAPSGESLCDLCGCAEFRQRPTSSEAEG